MTNLPIEYYIEEEHLKPIKPTIDMALKDGSLEMTVLSLEMFDGNIIDYINEEIRKNLSKEGNAYIKKLFKASFLEEFSERVIKNYNNLNIKDYFVSYEEFLTKIKILNREVMKNISRVLLSMGNMLEENDLDTEVLVIGLKEEKETFDRYSTYSPKLTKTEKSFDERMKKFKELSRIISENNYILNDDLIKIYNKYIYDFINKKGEIFELIKRNIKIIVSSIITKGEKKEELLEKILKNAQAKQAKKYLETEENLQKKIIYKNEYLS